VGFTVSGKGKKTCSIPHLIFDIFDKTHRKKPRVGSFHDGEGKEGRK
jgi:hypothetical protein